MGDVDILEQIDYVISGAEGFTFPRGLDSAHARSQHRPRLR